MITLITGMPGNGKTLLAVEWLVEGKFKDRDVYTNIEGLSPDLGCFRFDPDGVDGIREWYNLPVGAVIIVDEAQYPFPVRNPASALPKYISEFAVHRHRGYDIVLLTQGPKLLDSFLRPLIQDHYHVYRPYLIKGHTIFHWPSLNENPQPSQNLKSAQKKTRRFNKKIFDYYKSSSKHTDKSNFPKKVLFLIAFSFSILVGGLYWAYTRWLGEGGTLSPSVVAENSLTQVQTAVSSSCVPFVLGSLVEERCVQKANRHDDIYRTIESVLSEAESKGFEDVESLGIGQ